MSPDPVPCKVPWGITTVHTWPCNKHSHNIKGNCLLSTDFKYILSWLNYTSEAGLEFDPTYPLWRVGFCWAKAVTDVFTHHWSRAAIFCHQNSNLLHALYSNLTNCYLTWTWTHFIWGPDTYLFQNSVLKEIPIINIKLIKIPTMIHEFSLSMYTYASM